MAAEPRQPPWGSDLRLLAEVGREAGALALSFFRRNPTSWVKENESPVSDADIAVDRFLAGRLRAARPDYGWLSEETADDASRRGDRPVFIVDPIDGTREFLAGRNEWAVSIAIVVNGRPVAAALIVPAIGETFLASLAGGTELNGARIAAAVPHDLDGLRLAGPRRYLRNFAAEVGVAPAAIRFVGSLAYRLALVAAGRIDVALARAGSQDWDLAAADLLVQEAGGVLTDLAGRTLRYDRSETSHPPVVAAPRAIASEIRQLVADSAMAAIDAE